MSSHEVHSAKIMEWLEDRAGIRLKPEYFSKWFDTWSSSQGDTIHHNSEVVYKAAYEAFLRQSIEKSSRPVIPSNYADNSTKLFPPLGFERGGGVILQIMDCHDITRPLHSMLTVMTDKSRKPGVINFDENTGYTENSSKRVLRWVLSDGTHQIPALEKKRIAGIDMFTPFGCKLLISKCDVSLGILFLKPSNTKVLGGCVPRLYKGNMMKELINRFQQRLIIYNSKAVNNQNIHHEQISEEVDEYSDLDEADLNRINEMEAELSKPSTSYSSEASLNRTFVASDASPVQAPPPQEVLLPQKRPPPTDKLESVSKRATPYTSPFFSAPPSNPIPQPTSSEPKDSHQSGWLEENISITIDDEVVEIKQEKTKPTEDEPIDSVNRLHKLLTFIQDGKNVHYPDQVIMECKASKLSKLKITSSKGYYLIVHIIEPDSFNSMEVAVVFGNEIISGLLGVSHKEVIRLSKEAGSDDILKKIIRQLHEKLLSSRANVELDLSLMVNDASGFPTPRVLHYLIQ